MSHGFYPEGEGPGTDDPAQAHDRLCQCHICDYENDMEAQDLLYQQELAKFPPAIRRAVQIIAADHNVAHDDYSHRWWLAAVIDEGACPLAPDNSFDQPSIQPSGASDEALKAMAEARNWPTSRWHRNRRNHEDLL